MGVIIVYFLEESLLPHPTSLQLGPVPFAWELLCPGAGDWLKWKPFGPQASGDSGREYADATPPLFTPTPGVDLLCYSRVNPIEQIPLQQKLPEPELMGAICKCPRVQGLRSHWAAHKGP